MREHPVGLRAVAARWRGAAADAGLWAGSVALVALETDSVRAAPAAEAAVMAVVLAAAFALRRRAPFAALGVALAALVVQAVIIALTLVSTLVLSYAAVCAALAFSAGRRSDRTAPIVAMFATAALATLMAYTVTWIRVGDARETLTGVTDWAGGLAVLAAAVVAPWLLGRYRHRHAELRTAGWEIAERMERARDLDAERARLRERASIATRMHDSLGHDLALIAVRAAALEMAPEGGGAREAAAGLRAAAHDANLRLREIIGVLREDAERSASGGGDGGEDIAALVDRAVRAGLDVRLVREGPDLDPATPAGRAAHRVVQEALTNAARYAPGAAVTVRLDRGADATAVRVSDTGAAGGSAPRATGPAGGSGLAGLYDLVEGMGGGLSAGPGASPDGAAAPSGASSGGDGFTVAAHIPDTAEPAPGAGPEGTATETAQRLSGARRSARRRLAAALAVPTALAAAVVACGFAVLAYVGTNSVLPAEDYARLSVGQNRAAVERELPRFDYPARDLVDPPPAPPGSACRFYLVEWENGLPPVYRLCFADGRLAAKDRIARE
ncbi:sensor histidine kinase [Streptomonospora wellingtoniae]|uniref:histidine kinase n=1 Tax=Streptomonospora wellingtoniae TaxID=3075544 RepID=A0ABU2KWM3_9ACTN|nr:histidine kinase [Streptomonospora sp. DSM 45055]MDT0303689.1 histidine kinase [Streptomonospora sp. DSM 45055]